MTDSNGPIDDIPNTEVPIGGQDIVTDEEIDQITLTLDRANTLLDTIHSTITSDLDLALSNVHTIAADVTQDILGDIPGQLEIIGGYANDVVKEINDDIADSVLPLTTLLPAIAEEAGLVDSDGVPISGEPSDTDNTGLDGNGPEFHEDRDIGRPDPGGGNGGGGNGGGAAPGGGGFRFPPPPPLDQKLLKQLKPAPGLEFFEDQDQPRPGEEQCRPRPKQKAPDPECAGFLDLLCKCLCNIRDAVQPQGAVLENQPHDVEDEEPVGLGNGFAPDGVPWCPEEPEDKEPEKKKDEDEDEREPKTSDEEKSIFEGLTLSTVCEILQAMEVQGSFAVPTGQEARPGFLQGLSTVIQTFLLSFDTVTQGLFAPITQPLRVLAQGLLQFTTAADRNTSETIAKLKCANPSLAATYQVQLFLGALESWVSGDFSWLKKPVEQAVNIACQTDIITPEQALNAFLHDKMSEEEHKCIVNANNLPWDQWQRVTEASQLRLGVAENINLFLRRHISEGTLAKRLRELGFLRDGIEDELQVLAEVYPTPSEIIMMMVKDSDDPNVYNKFRLDDKFTDKFGTELRHWAEGQGITEKHMRYLWRAHWRIPSPTQLFDFYHRFRRNGQFGNEKDLLDDIEAALIQQDIPPFWIPKFLAASFRRINRIDIRRFFELGVFDGQQVEEAFIKLGFDDKDAEAQRNFVENNLRRKAFNRPVIKQYVNGKLNEAELRTALDIDGIKDKVQDEAVDWAKAEIGRITREKCVRNYKVQFKRFEIERDELKTKLQNWGLDPDQVDAFVQQAECERDSRSKEITAAKLCQMLEQKIITPAEYLIRLGRTGFDAKAANLMLENCKANLTEKEIKAAERDRNKALREFEKRRRAAIQADKDQDRIEEKRKAQARRMNEINKRRKKQMLGTASRAAKKFSLNVDEVYDFIQDLVRQVDAIIGGNLDLAIATVDKAENSLKSEDGFRVREAALELAQEVRGELP